MSILLRSAPLRAARLAVRAPAQQMRMMHVENVVDHTLPTSVTNKVWLATKMAVYATLGFGTPFYAAYWHVQKSAAGA